MLFGQLLYHPLVRDEVVSHNAQLQQDCLFRLLLQRRKLPYHNPLQ